MQLQVKSLLSLSELYQFLVRCASANLLHFLLMTHQKFYLVSISVFHRFCNLTTTCSFRNIFFHLVKQTFKTFTYFCCLHTAVGFLHPRLANSWPGFRNLIREATRGIIQPVQELLFAPITDQRADKLSGIIICENLTKSKRVSPTESVFKNSSSSELLLLWNKLLLH